MQLNIEQRAFIVGDQGICPMCEKEVKWSDVDTDWYVCTDCMKTITGGPTMDDNKSTDSEQDAYLTGMMDTMSEMLKSVLTEMIKKGDPALSAVRTTIKQVELEQDVKL